MVSEIKTIYAGKVVTLNLEDVSLPNGERCELEIVHHPGGVGIVAVDEQRRVCLLRQFRHAAGGWIWEIPAGRLETGEAPLRSAQRELKEEAGASAVDWVNLGEIFSSPGVFTEIIHLFLCRQLTLSASSPERHEVFEIHWLDWDEAKALIETGDIRDAKTLVALCLAQRHIE